jgi:hypothetical protein
MHPIPIARNGEEVSAAVQWKRASHLSSPSNEPSSAQTVQLNARCACHNLYPAIMMMKAAEDRLSSELAEPLDGPMVRRILFQGQMRSEFVVIAGVSRKDPAEMGLAEDDDVIEAFSSD